MGEVLLESPFPKRKRSLPFLTDMAFLEQADASTPPFTHSSAHLDVRTSGICTPPLSEEASLSVHICLTPSNAYEKRRRLSGPVAVAAYLQTTSHLSRASIYLYLSIHLVPSICLSPRVRLCLYASMSVSVLVYTPLSLQSPARQSATFCQGGYLLHVHTCLSLSRLCVSGVCHVRSPCSFLHVDCWTSMRPASNLARAVWFFSSSFSSDCRGESPVLWHDREEPSHTRVCGGVSSGAASLLSPS